MDQSYQRQIAHLTGQTQFVDDLDKPKNLLYGYIYKSPIAKGILDEIDIEEALTVNGICAIISYKDIPGKNDMGIIFEDEPILIEKHISYIGQAILLIAAKNKSSAYQAIKKIKIKYTDLEPVLDLSASYEKKDFAFEPLYIERGDVDLEFKNSDHVIDGNINIGGQEHFYLETQSALSVPRYDGTMLVHIATQNPSENQSIISHALNCDNSKIEVSTGAVGGGFGGKETQSNWCAVWSSILANHCKKPVIMVLDRREDMLITGKRHPCEVNYRVGFNKNGKINAYYSKFLFDIGYSADLSRSIIERALLHLDNAYYIPAIKSELFPCTTNRASNTAFRGFGAPQAIAVIEHIMEEIARVTKIDSAVVKKRNFYKKSVDNISPYGQRINDNVLSDMYNKIILSSDYTARVQLIKKYNESSKWIKRGISLVPVKFGIAFTTNFLNQGAALVNLYKDGSLVIHHGGVEMGQGLFDKMLNVAACSFGIPKSSIIISMTNTSVIPNTSATAASTGSDINGHAIQLAINRLKKRLNKFISTNLSCNIKDVVWENSSVYNKNLPNEKHSLSYFINKAYTSRLSLSEQAFYKTPGLFFDREKSFGNPFYYYVYGMSISEISLEVLTGEHTIIKSEILHDTGISLDPLVDSGQIEGAFIQCVGWCTLEELLYNQKGLLLTASPDSYKIPGISDIPKDFKIDLYQHNPLKKGIMKSRAVGEPPFIYGLSVWLAIKNAISYINSNEFQFDLPSTKEKILKNTYSYVKNI